MVTAGILERATTAREPSFVIKGGVALEWNLRDGARATKELDVALHHPNADLATTLERALTGEPYQGFSFRSRRKPLVLDRRRPGIASHLIAKVSTRAITCARSGAFCRPMLPATAIGTRARQQQAVLRVVRNLAIFSGSMVALQLTYTSFHGMEAVETIPLILSRTGCNYCRLAGNIHVGFGK